MINAFLSCNAKCVLLLDDLWGNLRREDVGIARKCKMVVVFSLGGCLSYASLPESC